MVEHKNILLIRIKAIGDVAFMPAAISMVRQAYPEARITFLTCKDHAQMAEGFQGLDETLALDRKRLRSGNPIRIFSEIWTLLRRLRGGKFSLAVDFQGFGETGWLAWLSRAPHRWGSVHCQSRRWAFTQGVTRDYRLHPIDWNLTLLRQCGLPAGKIVNHFEPPEAAMREARRFFETHALDEKKPVLFIQPFTSTPSKNWPLERQLEVARHWRERGGQVLFGGGPKEAAALEPARQEGFVISAGVSLLVTAGLMKLSTVVLGGDTGLLHLAVAMEKRVVMIIATKTPGSAHPYQHPSWAIAPPKGQTVSQVPASVVLAACDEALGELGVELPQLCAEGRRILAPLQGAG